jgi:predicted RNA-binding Zn-ribbon protein involved in translation (DUF1610 family)
MIKINCSSCQKPLSLDETKLPMREVTFPCPVCKAKVTIDRRELEGGGVAASTAETPAPAPAASGADDDDRDDHVDDFGSKALIVGVDSPALRQAAKLIGFLPVYQSDLTKAREYIVQENPQVIFVHPQQVTPPPLESMWPVLAITPSDRRKSFIILVADGLRTLDGNAAFLYGVNLVVATKDLGQFPQIYKDAFTYHERLYASVNAVTRGQQSI